MTALAIDLNDRRYDHESCTFSRCKRCRQKGELINAAEGYARNFLLPRKLAKEANAQVMNELKNAEASKAYKVKTETEEAQRIAEALKDKTVRITAKAGQGGRLFGSVTAKEIAQEIKKQYGFDIDKRKIHLDTDIKAFGGYHIEVKLYNGITAKLAVSVTEAQ